MASTSLLSRNLHSAQSIFVRGMRRKAPNQGKPPILPPSKTVRYHVVHVPWQKAEYVEELLWRRHVYNNAMTSIVKVFRDEIRLKESQGLGIEALREQELVELDDLIAQNDERNRKAAEERAERQIEKNKEIKKIVLDELEVTLNKAYEQSLEKTKEVEEMIERSKNFITKENLETKILEALEAPAVFDYAINNKGKRYYDPAPTKYQTGTPTRQKGRLYDRSLGFSHQNKASDSEATA